MTEASANPARIDGIDHVIIGVHDLEAARRIYTRLGFTVSPRGRHLGRGTANYCMMFDADYLELRGIVDASQFTDDLDRFLERGEGLNGVVFSTPDADACLAALRAAEVDVLPPMDVSRLIDLPDEEVSLRFKLLHLLPEATPGLHAIISQHLTLDLLRRPDWLSHANGARSVSEVTVVMADLKGVADSYAKLFGAAAIVAEERKGIITVRAGPSDILLTTPAAFRRRHYEVELDDSLPLPRLAALTLTVADPKATTLYLSGQQVEYETEPDGTVLVPAREACGVLLEFAVPA